MDQFQSKLKSKMPLIMGVLNVTPDSFSDGGEFFSSEIAIKHARQMMQEGADIIDVGAESSAPNSEEVPIEEEWRRLEPILQILEQEGIPFSVDTWKAEVARRAISLGALMINDITGFRGDEKMAEVLAAAPETYICIMYSKDSSARTTFTENKEENIVQKISSFFEERIQFCTEKGIYKAQIILDPGMGAFLSSDPAKSFEVLRNLAVFQKFECPLLVGTSRKSFLREVSDPENPKNRLIASIVTSLEALRNGAQIVRVHDVKEMREAMKTLESIANGTITNYE